MQDFLFFSRDELVDALMTLERAEMSGAQSVSYQGGGSAAMISGPQISIVKRKILRRLEVIDGANYGSGTRPRRVIPYFDSGYGQRVGVRNRSRGPFNLR